MINPFGKGFQVTPKGILRNKYNYNWRLAFPLLIVLICTILSFILSLFQTLETKSVNLGLWWSGYNIIMLSAALLTLLDVPQSASYQWFPLKTRVLVNSDNKIYSGVTMQLSETGAEIYLPKKIDLAPKISLEIIEAGLTITGNITNSKIQDQYNQVLVQFTSLNLQQQRKIIEMLYCRPGQWQKRHSPGELQSLWIILKILLRPLKFNKQ